MIIAEQTKVAFKVPEEHELMREFREAHSPDEWVRIETTEYVMFMRTQSVSIDTSGAADVVKQYVEEVIGGSGLFSK